MDVTLTLLLGLAVDIVTTQPSVARRINPIGNTLLERGIALKSIRGLAGARLVFARAAEREDGPAAFMFVGFSLASTSASTPATHGELRALLIAASIRALDKFNIAARQQGHP